MNKQEAFALHMVSLINDAINGHTGLLKSLAARLDDIECTYQTVTRDMKEDHRPVKDWLTSQADDLQKKLKRMMEDIVIYVGGKERMHELRREDFDNMYASSLLWLPEEEQEKRKQAWGIE